MKLYDYWRSSSAWRVRIALHLKGIAYERHPVNLIAPGPGGGEQHAASYTALNPLGQVPLLELDATEAGASPIRSIAQSMAILEFLDERFPAPPLLPAEPLLRARARQLAEMVNAGIQPLQNLSTTEFVKHELSGDAGAWCRHFVPRGLAALEATAAPTAGTFLLGDAVTLADVYLVPQLYAARRFNVDLGAYPTLLRAEAACAALPAFVAAHPDQQPERQGPILR
jgi:maleylpyruvate isomerase